MITVLNFDVYDVFEVRRYGKNLAICVNENLHVTFTDMAFDRFAKKVAEIRQREEAQTESHD